MRKNKKLLKAEYEADHKAAKIIATILQIALTVGALIVTEDLVIKALIGIFLFKEFLYYYGINAIAYVIEAARKHSHKHKVL